MTYSAMPQKDREPLLRRSHLHEPAVIPQPLKTTGFPESASLNPHLCCFENIEFTLSYHTFLENTRIYEEKIKNNSNLFNIFDWVCS